MANTRRIGIYRGFVSDRAAVAATVDFHFPTLFRYLNANHRLTLCRVFDLKESRRVIVFWRFLKKE